MRAFTVHQPWATAIAVLGKPIENRTWRLPRHVIGERVALHAGLYFEEAAAEALAGTELAPGVTVRWFAEQPRGAVIATLVFAGVVTSSRSPWFSGPFGWQLEDVRALREPVYVRGAQGLWVLPEHVERQVLAQDAVLNPASQGDPHR